MQDAGSFSVISFCLWSVSVGRSVDADTLLACLLGLALAWLGLLGLGRVGLGLGLVGFGLARFFFACGV
jgi:hypothetical protein